MIEQQLLETGILQLGLFAENGTHAPYRLRLELLPAYPELFRDVVNRVIAALPDAHSDRLVAEANATALGAAVSLKTGLSLVYSQGCGATPVHDLAGAYNFGHPAALLVNTVTPTVGPFIKSCAHVGLSVHSIVTVVGENVDAPVPVYPIVTLETIIRGLQEVGKIPDPQAQTILKHLRTR